ncbi:MAG: Tetratricopeptide repeat protein [Nitrospira sp.]|nr:MAG: Tetratricopeptide repeat protein [Nitrospira sp.]
MYENFYNLRAKPFALLPDSDFLYAGSVHRAAYGLLEYGILSQAPFMVLTGDPGMGKTSLLQKLIAEHGQKYSIGLITNARYDIEHLLPWILLSLGLSTKRLDPVEAYHVFTQFLAQESKQHRRVILVVDEAQSLGVELLEELRLLSNLNDGKTLKLQIILSGQPDLQALLQRIDMTQFAQRIVVDYHLDPLTEAETGECIRHRLRVAGGAPSLFTNKSCALIHRLTKGNPRLINQVCEIALTYGFAEQAQVITSKLVAQAALDRSKGGILPLAGREELAMLAAASEDTTEIETPIPQLNGIPQATDKTPVPSKEQQAETLYQDGLRMKSENRFEEALALFEEASKHPVFCFKAHAQIGVCYRTMGNVQSAIHAFRIALNDSSASSKEILDLQYMLARSLQASSQNTDALTIYRQLAQAQPDYRDVTNRIKQLATSTTTERTNGDSKLAALDSWVSQAFNSLHRLIGTPRS